MKTQKLFIVAMLLFANVLIGQLNREDYPARIIVNATNDPAHSFAVTCKSYARWKNAEVQVVLSNAGPIDIEKMQYRKYILSEDSLLTKDSCSIYFYSSIVLNLSPNTNYSYRVYNGSNWNEWNNIKTADTLDTEFSVLYFGDPQNDIVHQVPRVFREAFKTKPSAALQLFAGDLVGKSMEDSWWEELYYAGDFMFKIIPSIMTPGNHEYQGENRTLTPFWKKQFTLPGNGLYGLEETSYYIDYQGVRFVALNTNEKLEEQTDWLDDILSGNNYNWSVLIFHHPIYSVAKERDQEKIRNLFLPMIDKHNVDLVLQGHDHAYGRSFKMKNGIKVNNDEQGTVFVVSVSGPKQYELNNRIAEYFECYAEKTELFQVIEFSESTLSFKAYTANGSLFDQIKLVK